MMAAAQGEDEPTEYVARRGIAVRLAAAQPEALYERICRTIDVAADAGAGPEAGNPFAQVWQSHGLVTYGVDDLKSLRAEAIANGLDAAQEVAQVVAEGTGRRLGTVSGVQVQEYGTEGYLAIIGTMVQAPKPGVVVHRASLTVTFSAPQAE